MSETDGVRLLAIGDVHLGTRPGSLPESLLECGVPVSDLTPEAALEGAVERAIQERVHAVLFAGDVVESTNARFEALRPLERAVERLRAESIRVLAVVGNHDVEALPRLAQRIEGLELLGVGGRWESKLIEVAGQPAIEVVGWSFPERQVRTSPVAALLHEPLERRHPGIPRLGLLHGDLDAAGGTYAPFSRSELEAAGMDAWLLGHIHKPSLGDGTGDGTAGGTAGGTGMLYGYLGSLVGLSPKETGPHGPWLIHLDAAGHIRAEQVVIAPLRWEHVDLEVGETEDPTDLGDRLLDEGERVARELDERGHAPRALGLRVRLVGRTQHFDSVRQYTERGDWKSIEPRAGKTVVFIDKVTQALSLAQDLKEIARGDDPPALMAQKLLILAHGGEQRQALLRETREKLRSIASEGCWAHLDDVRDAQEPLADELLGAALLQSGTHALNVLLSQHGVQQEPGEATP